jgi:hypothetical protein
VTETNETIGALLEVVPEFCQRDGCGARVQTWCPLCTGYYCDLHDQLTPLRRHRCLGEDVDE